MNRATRRPNAAAQRAHRRRWERDVTRFHNQSGGLLTLELLRPTAMLSDFDRTGQLLVNWYRSAAASPAGMLCLTCNADLQPPVVPSALLVSSNATERPAKQG